MNAANKLLFRMLVFLGLNLGADKSGALNVDINYPYYNILKINGVYNSKLLRFSTVCTKDSKLNVVFYLIGQIVLISFIIDLVESITSLIPTLHIMVYSTSSCSISLIPST